MSMTMPLDEFLSELRKLNLKVKISTGWYGFSVEIIFEKEAIGWISISLNDKGYVDVTGVTVMDDINASRNLEVTAAKYHIHIKRTNKVEQEAIRNLPY